jgi:crossover junction endodeoxyribonuclease RusA
MAMTYVTPEAKQFKEQVGWVAKAAGVRTPLQGRIAIAYTLHPRLPQDWERRAKRDPMGWEDTVMCMDLDNANKVLLDSMKGVVFEDDKWVRTIFAQRGTPRAEACLVVHIKAIELVSPQKELA